MAGKEPDTGPTAKTVAANVRRLRTNQNLNYTQLSERLQDIAGWSINAVGIRRIESGERRVTPDDLMALALALRVWPITLLMPDTETGDHAVTATGLPKSVTAEEFWDWLTASDGLYDHGGNEWVETAHMGHPHWKVRSHYESAYRDFRNTVQGLRREGVDLDHLAAALRDDEHGDD